MPRNESTDDTASPVEAVSNGSPSTTESSAARPSTESRFPTVHDERAIRTAGTVVFGGLAVAIVLFLVSLLPAIDASGRAFAALASGVLAISFAATLGYGALIAPRSVRRLIDGPRTLREPAASAAVWTFVLATILTLHRGFTPLVALIDGPLWLHDGLFLLLAIGPLALVARALWTMIDPAAALLSDRFAGSP